MWDWTDPPFAIQRIEVPNSGFMRGQPTNCYILGEGPVVIVDPGSEPGVDLVPDALKARGNPDVQAIFLTHAHPDHAISAPALRRLFGAPVMLHPENCSIMGEYISQEDVDIRIDPAQKLIVGDISLECIMTPGHAPGHVALIEPKSRAMIAGDLVSGNGTIGVFPPNGSMIEYIESLRTAKARNPSVLLPGHGPVIEDAPALFEHYLERRLGREAQILEIISDGGASISDILPVLYPDLLPENSFPAEATILAHLLKLEHDGRARQEGNDPKLAVWQRTGAGGNTIV